MFSTELPVTHITSFNDDSVFAKSCYAALTLLKGSPLSVIKDMDVYKKGNVKHSHKITFSVHDVGQLSIPSHFALISSGIGSLITAFFLFQYLGRPHQFELYIATRLYYPRSGLESAIKQLVNTIVQGASNLEWLHKSVINKMRKLNCEKDVMMDMQIATGCQQIGKIIQVECYDVEPLIRSQSSILSDSDLQVMHHQDSIHPESCIYPYKVVSYRNGNIFDTKDFVVGCVKVLQNMLTFCDKGVIPTLQ